MHNRDYYFIKPYDETLPKPPVEKFGAVLKETYTQPFNWKGRTTRRSYWLSVIPNAILSIISLVFFFSAFIGIAENDSGSFTVDFFIGLVIGVFTFITSLGQLIRRLHDVDYSGYWYWVTFVPGVGSFFLFYLCLQPSVQKPTKWGTYLFTDEEVYHEIDEVKVPEPSIRQILKEHFFDCFKWNARSTRTSFWVASAVNSVLTATFAVCLVFSCLALFTSGNMMKVASLIYQDDYFLYAILVKILPFIILILSAALIWLFLAQLGHTIRRLHDAGLNGAWYLISLIPYLLYFILIIHVIINKLTGQPVSDTSGSLVRSLTTIVNVIFAFLLFHPSTQKDVQWKGYLFDKDDEVDDN